MPKKRKCLKLFTKTWPPKDKENEEEESSRPLTATLDKPTILDIRFIDKIDMSLMRKEFFPFTNLCRIPLTIALNKVVKPPQEIRRRPLSLPSSEKYLVKRTKNHDTSEEDDSSTRSARNKIAKTKQGSILTSVRPCKKTSAKNIDKPQQVSDSNNNTKASYKLTSKLPPSTLTKVNCLKSTKLPEPCKTCGRSDQPERLHSHPVTVPRTTKKMEENVKIPVKNTVQKPMAIKYKPKQPPNKDKTPSPRKKVLPPKKPEEPVQRKTANQETPRVRSAKRTLTCYLCGREFGTASLSLHEPKCLEVYA